MVTVSVLDCQSSTLRPYRTVRSGGAITPLSINSGFTEFFYFFFLAENAKLIDFAELNHYLHNSQTESIHNIIQFLPFQLSTSNISLFPLFYSLLDSYFLLQFGHETLNHESISKKLLISL